MVGIFVAGQPNMSPFAVVPASQKCNGGALAFWACNVTATSLFIFGMEFYMKVT